MKNSDPNWFLRARLKTRQLLLLIALDDTRNIHRASSELNMTQPAASKQLKDLEDMLGVSLFERLPRGMRPTIYGEAMIRHARMALTSLSKAHEDIVALKSGLSGQVDVGVILSPGMALLPPAIARVKEHAPMLRIGVEVESSNILLSRLLHGELDFIIGRILDEEAKHGLHYQELADEPVCAVARVGHPLHAHPNLKLSDMANEPWILAPKGSILRARCDQMFREEGLAPPSNVVDTTAILFITSLLQQTDFLYAMPTEVARYYTQARLMDILPIELPCRMAGFGIITRQDNLLSPGATMLLQAIREVAKMIY
ncbi:MULTISPECIES: LysR family transcriptional regulator [unclassified Herbaspirillum]|uniref:LysR family transcriptional regulator n=1 Tax=unclassified Herbaspirillum TaxID=2624150 RepID=UPI00114F939B|nr:MULTISPECIES: LysR family transcriptional regulator [unclassified Herbaspirillum]MBB5390673.1 DNA-binding transcriptional LysR family regulator [Herbaspirillum sp. SJZ102]TQK08841.1 DNA-binding transcriptional LysR family regulator [Herbaspirillum sp. SJZ130]TWC66511.1 DNA-binding transcriptional LysR family regulator [Herbaspirillum sp. SJZ099]